MSDQTALNSIVVENLADLEAASRHVEEVVTPMVQDELLRLAAEFLDEHTDWAGEADDIDNLWLAPAAWRDVENGEHEYLCYFELRTVPGRDAADDRFWLSALTGAGSGKVGLVVVSDRLGDGPLGKLVAGEAELVQRLQAEGFVYDVAGGRTLYLPVALDREQLVADLREEALDITLEPVRRALDAAAASVPLVEPMVGTIRTGAQDD